MCSTVNELVGFGCYDDAVVKSWCVVLLCKLKCVSMLGLGVSRSGPGIFGGLVL